jgi:magnesium transporter
VPVTGKLPAARDSARWHLATSIPVAAADDTVDEVLSSMRGRHFDCADPVVVVDAKHRVLGRIPLGLLVEAPPGRTAVQVMQREPPSVQLDTDQERIASIALQHDVAAVTVANEDGTLAGVIPAQALLGILRREHVEDLHRLAGIVSEEAHLREAMEAPPMRRARHRMPWLLLGLAGSVLAALVMQRFEHILSTNVAVAFFIPGIVYLADAVGTQTETITVRGLSLSHARIGLMLAGEIRTGLLIGGLLGGAAFVAAWLVLDQPRLAVAVGLALCAASAIATTIGLALPWLLHRLGRDPAYGSGPLATIMQDVLTVTVYFLVVSALLE